MERSKNRKLTECDVVALLVCSLQDCRERVSSPFEELPSYTLKFKNAEALMMFQRAVSACADRKLPAGTQTPTKEEAPKQRQIMDGLYKEHQHGVETLPDGTKLRSISFKL